MASIGNRKTIISTLPAWNIALVVGLRLRHRGRGNHVVSEILPAGGDGGKTQGRGDNQDEDAGNAPRRRVTGKD